MTNQHNSPPCKLPRRSTKELFLLLIALTLFSSIGFSQTTKRIYLIGNSVTDAINYAGFKSIAESKGNTHIWARHMIPGAPLAWLWEHRTEGFMEEPYGYPENAFANYDWDAITLQPFDRHLDGTDGDVAIAGNYVNIAKGRNPNVQFYIYSRWTHVPAGMNLGDAGLTADKWNSQWLRDYTGSWDFSEQTQDYFEKLVVECRNTYTSVKPFIMIPVGDVFYSLNNKMKNGQVPGYSNIWQWYNDGVHVNSLGSYAAALTFYATIYKADPRGTAVPSQYGTIPSEVVTQIQSSVWDVVTTNPYTGISSSNIAVTGVSLNNSAVTLANGATSQLTATVAPTNATNKSVTWSTSNSLVATVSSTGLVTATGAGTATITVTTADGAKTATCSVTVNANTGGGQTSGVLANWELTGKGGQTNIAGANLLSGINAANLTIGAGLSAVNWFADGLQANGSNATTLATAISNNDYVTFTLTPATGKTFSISSIKYAPASQNRARTFALLSSENGFSAANVISSFTSDGTGQQTISITGHDNLSAAIEFRVYIYAATNNEWEAVGVNNVSGVDLEINGSVGGTADTQAPTKATSLQAASVKDKSFTLSWTNATDNVGVTGYDVYNGTTKVNSSLITTNSYAVTGLTVCNTYSFTVKAYDAAGNSSTSDALSVKTNCAPTAVMSATPQSGTAPLAVAFSANGSTDPDAGDYILGYEWNFGDGSAIDNSNAPSHTYTAAGTYTATLKVMDNRDLYSAAVTKTITVSASGNTNAKLTGTVIGTSGSWNNSGNTRDKVFDGNTASFFDAAEGNGVWAGLDLGSAKKISKIRFYPRDGYTYRMNSGKFQASNTANFSSGVVDLYSIASEPSLAWAEVTVTNTNTYRYVRYLSPDNGYGNVAEVEFYGNSAVLADGYVTREVWNNISGTSVTNIPVNSTPSATSQLSSLEGPSNVAEDYGARIRGYIVPTTAGNYTFYIAGDDNSQLFLASNDDPANKIKIAEVVNWTDSRQWTKETSQKSAVKTLAANTKYYFEVLHKEGNGGDNVAVGWTGPGISAITVIGSANISSFAGGTPPSPVEPAAVPTNLSASSISENGFILSWAASANAVNYDVLKDGISVGTTTNTSMNISGLTCNSAYSMSVKAANNANQWSTASNALSVNTSSCPPPPPTTTTANSIGFNIGGPMDWSEDRIFADVFKCAREWKKIGSDTKAAVDAKGWPTEDAAIQVWHGIGNMHGTYKLRFTGKATLTGATIQNQVYNASTNITTADLISNGDGLYMTFTGTNGGVKNVKLMKPITPGSTTSYNFTDEWTNEIKAIMAKASVVRFLGMSACNGDVLTVNWSQRVPDDYFWASLDKTGYGWEGRGASWETMIRFCNDLNIDGWINVPVSASDDYIRELAKLWKNGLESGRKLYIEYSNEVWNTAGPFGQSSKNWELAKAEVAAGSSLNFDGETNDWYWAWRRVAKRIVDISNIFRSEWGDAAMMTNIRPVLMWQQPNGQSTADEQLQWLDYYSALNNKPINYYLYGASGSAYYNPQNDDPNLTIDNIWNSASFNLDNWKPSLLTDGCYAAAMGAKRVAYEGGPSMDVHFDRTHPTEIAKANSVKDSRMKDIVVGHHNLWSNYGGDLLVYLHPTGDYQWGFTDNIYNLNTPKYDAINTLNSTNRAGLTAGYTVPVDITGSEAHLIRPGWKSPGIGTHRLSNKEWIGYMIRITADGNYNVSIDYAYANPTTITFNVDGGVVRATEQITATEGSTPTRTVYLTKGLHFIRVMSTGGDLDLVRFKVKAGAGTKSASEITSIANNNQTGLLIYPNPVQNKLSINFGSTIDNANVSVFDMQGHMVMNRLVSNTEVESIDVNSLNSGVYIIKVVVGDKIINSRIVKK